MKQSHRHSPLPNDGDADSVDPVRRQLTFGLALLPAAAMVTGPGAAWALANSVRITESGGMRTITSNAIPDHATGRFPNSHNPNAISAQNLTFTTTLKPRVAGRFTSGQGWQFGVAVNGVPFDPYTAEFWNNDRNWNYDAVAGFVDLGLDRNNAHVQPGGKYHYHGWPTGLVRAWSPEVHSPIAGWAADGFPIYIGYGYREPMIAESGIAKLRPGWRIKRGRRNDGPGGSYDGRFFQDWEWQTGIGDLDQANGRECVTPDYPNGTYAYFVTTDWPQIPRYFVGTPDQSFRIGPGAGQGMGQRQRGQGQIGVGQRPPRRRDELRPRPPPGMPPPKKF